jgi:membrane protein involved in colicin uptake
MGGSPKISGGMTYAEQQKLMQEEREFQKQQEAERRAYAEQEEAKRIAREEAERARIKSEEEARLAEIAASEEKAAKEAAYLGQQESEASSATATGATTKLFDFYSALYSGMGNRPQ